jgi:hypothetical protein
MIYLGVFLILVIFFISSCQKESVGKKINTEYKSDLSVEKGKNGRISKIIVSNNFPEDYGCCDLTRDNCLKYGACQVHCRGNANCCETECVYCD